ncbi:MAG: gamma carbonic anhydrase family protein [Alphaproteobacteria bacterium]|nr:gamma carbonic anhydrase family protein [Alphaproteobacteria bacterium]
MIQTFREHAPQVDPTAWVHPMATVIGQVELGPGVTVWPAAVLRGDMGLIRIGEDANVQDGAVVHMTSDISNTLVGPRVTVGHRAVLHGCVIEGDALIGMGAILLDNCHIPANCVVGAGALVTANKRFPPHSLILGSPARVARSLNDQDLEWIRYSWSHYKETAVHYRG